MEQSLYVNQAENPPVRRPKTHPKDRRVIRTGTTVALSRGLHKGLQQGLYQNLYQGAQTRQTAAAAAAPKLEHAASDKAEVRVSGSVESLETPNPEVTIRRIGLLSGETVTHAFCPEEGLIPQPRDQGRMLVLTNHRVIAFENKDGARETVLMPVDQVKVMAVNAGLRSKFMMFQGAMIVLAGVVIYVLLAYWLTGRIDGPTIPVIRMDLVAFLVFLAILSSVGIMTQFYFSRPDGEVTFQGDGVKLAFPFRGETAENDIYQVVNAAFAARQTMMGYTGMESSGPGGN